jgi:hypothetical protein
MNEYYMNKSTGNVYEVLSRDNGYVKTERIGVWDVEDGSFTASPWMGFVVAEYILAHMVENGLVPVVRMMGDGFMSEDDYADLLVHRAN